MPSCCIPNCKNRTEKGFRLFQLPQNRANEQKRQMWLQFINRAKLPSRVHVCEAHFDESQFELNRQDGRKLLKWNAVPTIPVSELQSPRVKKEQTDETGWPVGENYNGVYLDVKSDISIEEDIKPTVLTPIDDENEWCDHLQYQNLKSKLKNAQQTIRLLQKRVRKMEETYKELFNEDQIYFMTIGSHKGMKWSEESIEKGLKLYMACGTKGYEEIRKQKLPYPCIRTLQECTKKIKFEGVSNEVTSVTGVNVSN